MRLINADEYMSHLRANINTTADIIAKYIKKDKPIGTVSDGGQIGYLNALQWARASLECDCYTVQAIPIPDNATNGDMIKAMFPNLQIVDVGFHHIVVIFGDYYNMMYRNSYDEDWWNAPYEKRGDIDDSN